MSSGCVPGCAVSLAALASVIAGVWLDRHTDGAAGLTAALVLAVLAAMAARPRLSSMFAAMPLLVAIIASVDAGRPVVPLGRFGFLDAEAVASAVVAIPLAATAVTWLGVRVSGTVATQARPRFPAALRVLAWSATLGAAALLVVAATQLRRPSARTYVASLTVVERLPAGRTVGKFVVRHLVEGGCVAWPSGEVAREMLPEERQKLLQSLRFDGCGPVAVRRDDARRATILEDAAGHRIAFSAGRPVGPTQLRQQLGGALRPPDAFVALAALGLAGALLVLLRRRRALLDDVEGACHDAEAFDDGTLAIDDGTPLPLPAEAPRVVGPVVAVLATPAEGFREHAGPKVRRVVPGTLAELRFAQHGAPSAFALVFVVVASTPLATALVVLQ